MYVNTCAWKETKKGFHGSREIPVKRRGGGFEQAISRILSLCCTVSSTGGNHLSRTPVTRRLKRPTRRLTGEQPASGSAKGPAIPPVRSCSGWGLPRDRKS